jgi:hypothetical protein
MLLVSWVWFIYFMLDGCSWFHVCSQCFSYIFRSSLVQYTHIYIYTYIYITIVRIHIIYMYIIYIVYYIFYILYIMYYIPYVIYYIFIICRFHISHKALLIQLALEHPASMRSAEEHVLRLSAMAR